MTSAHIFQSAAGQLLAHPGVKGTGERRDRGEALPDRSYRHVYSCGETAEVLERASKQSMASRPVWPSPLARLSVFGL